jgi:tetratricopeptide (TPR) repeat protein
VNITKVSNSAASISKKMKLVSKLFTSGKFEKAKTTLNGLHRSFPKDETVIKACISLYKKLGDTKQAIIYAEKLFALTPSSFDLAVNLSNWCIQEGLVDRAINCYLKHVEAKSESQQAYFQLGLLYKQQQAFENAILMFEQAIFYQFQPLEECYLNLALVYGEIRQEKLAIKCLNKTLEIAPSHLLAKFNLATLCQSSGNKTKALSLYEEILQKDPSFVEALIRLIYAKKMTPDDAGLLKQLNRRIRSSQTSMIEREGLHYAQAKASDDLLDYSNAFNSAKSANQLNGERIGKYDASIMANFVDQSISKYTSHWVNLSPISSSIEPIFIIGHFRSGSTLIEQILSGHRSVTSLGEVDYFLRFYHQQSDKFWRLATQDSNEDLELLAEGYSELIAVMSQNEHRITDKRPENILFMGLIKKLFPKAKFIHTKRNLLDNAISVYFQQLNDLSKFSTSLLDFSDYDAQCQRLMNHWKSAFGDDIYEIYYEDLVSEPRQKSQEMLAFSNLTWEEKCLDFDKRDNFVRTASVSQVRNKIYTTSVGRGSNYVSFLTEIEKKSYEKWII